MKKIVSAVFVFLFLFNIAGYYLWFGLQRYEIRKDVKTEIKKRMRLKKEALTLIIISEENKNEVLWIKIGKEFKYRGALYDVVSFEQKNGKKYYYCINDVKEKQLIEQFLKTHKTSERSSEIKKLTHSDYFLTENIISYFDVLTEIKYPVLNCFYSSVFTEIISPPPQKA